MYREKIVLAMEKGPAHKPKSHATGLGKGVGKSFDVKRQRPKKKGGGHDSPERRAVKGWGDSITSSIRKLGA